MNNTSAKLISRMISERKRFPNFIFRRAVMSIRAPYLLRIPSQTAKNFLLWRFFRFYIPAFRKSLRLETHVLAVPRIRHRIAKRHKRTPFCPELLRKNGPDTPSGRITLCFAADSHLLALFSLFVFLLYNISLTTPSYMYTHTYRRLAKRGFAIVSAPSRGEKKE